MTTLKQFEQKLGDAMLPSLKPHGDWTKGLLKLPDAASPYGERWAQSIKILENYFASRDISIKCLLVSFTDSDIPSEITFVFRGWSGADYFNLVTVNDVYLMANHIEKGRSVSLSLLPDAFRFIIDGYGGNPNISFAC